MRKKINKSKILKLIILLIIVEIVCIITLNLIKSIQEKSKESVDELQLAEKETENNKYTYTYFDNIINQFFEHISEQNAEALISVLDKEFINEKSLNSQNVVEYFKDYKLINSYVSKEVYSQKITYAQIYKGEYNCIKGTIIQNEKEENIFFIIKQDYNNSTFNISIITEKSFEKMKNSENISDSLEVDIQKNNYNKINAKIDI